MCLAIPGKVEQILDDDFATVDFMGIKKKVAFDLIQNYKVGDYVIVHAGFAINKLNKEDALETIKHFKEL